MMQLSPNKYPQRTPARPVRLRPRAPLMFMGLPGPATSPVAIAGAAIASASGELIPRSEELRERIRSFGERGFISSYRRRPRKRPTSTR